MHLDGLAWREAGSLRPSAQGPTQPHAPHVAVASLASHYSGSRRMQKIPNFTTQARDACKRYQISLLRLATHAKLRTEKLGIL